MTLHLSTAWRRRPGDEAAGSPESPEDEATLSRIAVNVDRIRLTQTLDLRTMRVHDGANLSAYRLAEWLTWNWWRLRWEPPHQNVQRDRKLGWRRAHELAGIGGGWLWPNVTVRSDGLRIGLDALPSPEVEAEPLRYLASRSTTVSAESFEAGVDDFVERVLARLDECALGGTDLATSWKELAAERADPESTAYRQIEAFLGCDVDEADPQQVERIILDGRTLGSAAMAEVAADGFHTADELREEARSTGFDACGGDGVRVLSGVWDGGGQRSPWEVGTEAADALRRREGLTDGPVPDHRLADLCAVPAQALTETAAVGTMAFALHKPGGADRIVLHSKWRIGRRFEAARLLADSVLVETNDRLRPATGASTYRQKMQRAFAAEFLCPFGSLIDTLDDDFSEEARDAAAARFGVSPLAVTTVLANHGVVDRQEALYREA